jgi:hypothetical protein
MKLIRKDSDQENEYPEWEIVTTNHEFGAGILRLTIAGMKTLAFGMKRWMENDLPRIEALRAQETQAPCDIEECEETGKKHGDIALCREHEIAISEFVKLAEKYS